ncbi:substrate-binding domain-containing protein [Kitasatospora sp. NPDC015120]|uniref:substrate-binding domain-containing protein n=1 Tax=Kitasatospora sp. NPDC015120 TaxID=3364023 RepID=UPI0036F4920C
MLLRLTARAASALALASTLALAVVTPAPADPPYQPAAIDVVGTGSALTEQLIGRFAAEYNASLPAGDTTSPRLHSWDSTGSSPLTPKAGATPVPRPYSSNSGINTLTATTGATVDFARSSRGPEPGDPVNDLFVALAKDAVGWAAPAGGNAPADLPADELKRIFSCLRTNWRDISPDLPDAEIRPVLPALPSETRWAFLRMVGLTGVGPFDAPGPCVTVVERENQGTDAILHDPNALVPYSVGHYLGQRYAGPGRPGDEPGILTPRGINGISSFRPGDDAIEPAYAQAFGHVLYVVVREADWTSPDTRGQALRAIFGKAGWACRSTPTIRTHGFRPLPPTACGSTTHA